MNPHALFPLNVRAVKPETADAVSITFDVPPTLHDTFRYSAGQYLTLQLNPATIGSTEAVRRSYSLSSSPDEAGLTVSVKRLDGGLVSTYLTTQLKAGDTLEVMQPEGRFTLVPSAATRRTYCFVGAGSGITPLFSMLKHLLEQEPKSTVHLLYGNRTEESIMFRAELDAMQTRYEGQLFVEHILSKPKAEKTGGLTGFFKKPVSTWRGHTGRIDAAHTTRFLNTLHNNPATEGTDVVYYLCGPVAMMQTVEQVLTARGVTSKSIHKEAFFIPTDATANANSANAPMSSGSVAATITLHGKTHQITIAPKQTLLDAALKAGIDAPFSCKGGACSTCIAKLSVGKVTMDNCFALEDDEIAKGYILTCQAHPTTANVTLTFDV